MSPVIMRGESLVLHIYTTLKFGLFGVFYPNGKGMVHVKGCHYVKVKHTEMELHKTMMDRSRNQICLLLYTILLLDWLC